MNSERRHELQENELANSLARFSKQIEPYSKWLLAGVIAVIALVFGLSFYSTTRTETRSDATLQLLQAGGSGDPEVFARVAEKYPDTAAAHWARLYTADQLMADGMAQLFEDREEALNLLGDAAESYGQALKAPAENTITSRTLRSRAHYGLARIAEAQGNVDEAIAEYKSVMEADESEAMTELASDRIEALESPATQDFLTWFGEQDFAPAEPSLPPALPDASELPESPDMELPDLGLGLETEEPTTDPADETTEEMADTKPADTEPAEQADTVAEDTAGDAAEAEATDAEVTDAEPAEAEATEAEATDPEATEADAPEADVDAETDAQESETP
ncbi:tetratricopeptide repeat protein [Crateriforma spongiae]|uniref:tetratricopeptide repeat protein n=1 Tax=Crateriforma spongiae TaxID=2724528 RepID=UPI001446D8D4|nr:tetratricopeptide repeat protein [Crateriforma spongiae]